MVATTSGFGFGGKCALVDADVVVFAEMGLNDVVELHAGGWPSADVRRGDAIAGVGGRRIAECPHKHAAHVLKVVALTGILGLVAEYSLVDPDVGVVAQVRLDDVVEVDAGRWPLRTSTYRGTCGHGHRRGDGQHQTAKSSLHNSSSRALRHRVAAFWLVNSS